MAQTFFITGTDTGVGKTRVAVAMLHAMNHRGLETLALKPLAAGAESIDGEPRNDDADQLQRAASVKLSYQQVNPVLLNAPMAPHLAALRERKTLSLRTLSGFCRGTLMTQRHDVALIEGAGGWRVPLNPRETLADLPRELNTPVILVVGMKLGCLNHALLTAEAIQRDGLRLAGWVANTMEVEMEALEANIETLVTLLRAPLLGVLPVMKADERVSEDWIDLDVLLGEEKA